MKCLYASFTEFAWRYCCSLSFSLNLNSKLDEIQSHMEGLYEQTKMCTKPDQCLLGETEFSFALQNEIDYHNLSTIWTFWYVL